MIHTRNRGWFFFLVTTPLLLLIGIFGCCELTASFHHPTLLLQQQQQRPSSSLPKSKSKSSTALMGIRGFRGWFESQFGSSMTQVSNQDCDSFDHVLIDLNPLLHVCLRKSRTDGHGLTLLFKELDSLLLQIKPTQSLVLAMDGPPSAAKLATQRKRRWQVLQRSESKLQQLQTVGTKRLSTKQISTRKRRYESECRTLRITPGTEFMELAEQALLFWAWQRLDARRGDIVSGSVKVFVSSSTVAGEGEVKLLEWIYQKPRRGESIAILSGDSDSVLEGLLVPMPTTHNVFVIWPAADSRGKNKHLVCVGLFETTRRLHELVPTVEVRNLMRLRTDLVLLLFLNGNDYLPKLRGASGFNKLFGQYVRMQREWQAQSQQSHVATKPTFLVDPNTLELNLDVCLEYFGRLAKMLPLFLKVPSIPSSSSNATTTATAPVKQGISPLQTLHSFVDAGYLPKPIRYRIIDKAVEPVNGESMTETLQLDEEDDILVVNGEDENDDSDGGEPEDEFGGEEDVETDDDDVMPAAAEEPEDEILVQMHLGVMGTDDYFVYETWHPRAAPQKLAKQKLAKLALVDLLDLDDDPESDIDDDEFLASADSYGGKFEWELPRAVESNVQSYMYGLLWNLQTYQDGVCADYAWNYGKRLAPTAHEVVKFLSEAKRKGRTIGVRQLQSGPFSPPIHPGVACLAALPSEVKHLVPEPYRWLSDETVEELYGMCMNKDDNSFDALGFQRLCNEHIAGLPPINGEASRNAGMDDYWTVISKVRSPLAHPCAPPEPFTERHGKLRPNNRIRISKVAAVEKPRPRSVWGQKVVPPNPHVSVSRELNHSEPAPFMLKLKSLDDLTFKVAYPNHAKKPKRSIKTSEMSTALHDDTRVPLTLVACPSTVDGVSAAACLKQLEDSGIVGTIVWDEQVRPDKREVIRLCLRRGGNDKKSSVLDSDLEFEQVRESHSQSKKLIRQQLANLALSELTGPELNWSDYTFKDIKHSILRRSREVTTRSKGKG